MTSVSAIRLEGFLTAVFEAAGTPADIAPVPAEHLVRADASGYESHGAVHIDHYLNEIDAGVLRPDGRPEVVSSRAASALVDANHGWGHFAGLYALDLAMEMAADVGTGAVSVRNCTHIGRLGHYAEEAAARGYISLITWGAGQPPTWGPPKSAFHLAVPYGGAAPTLSTNPFAVGVPTGDDAPFIVDFATTVIANAKTWIYRDRGEPLPADCALDRDGNPTTDPDTYLDGGMLRIFGAHKGYGISLLTCLLGGLTGNLGGRPEGMEGPFFLVIDPTAFQPRDDYEHGVRSFLDGMRHTRPAAGFDAVQVPGYYEVQSRRRHAGAGIELSPAVLKSLAAAGGRFGVSTELLAPEPGAAEASPAAV